MGSQITQMSKYQVLSIIRQSAIIVQDLQRKGVAHNNICADNLCLDIAGDKIRVTLTNFGQSATLGSPLRTLPKAAYVAPELQQGGPADASADVFSLGCLVQKLAQRLSDVPALMLPPEVQSWAQAASSCPKEQRPDTKDLIRLLNTVSLHYNNIG